MSEPVFYTTAEQEATLLGEYEYEVIEKQKEMNMSGKRYKYTAKAYIKKPDVVFFVDNNNIRYGSKDGPEMIQNDSGKIYKIDSKFIKKLEAFAQKHKKYWITFHVTGKYGNSIGYIAGKDEYPATVESNGEVVSLDDEDAYDIRYF